MVRGHGFYSRSNVAPRRAHLGSAAGRAVLQPRPAWENSPAMAEEPEQKSDRSSGPRRPGAQTIGAILVLLILAAYFLWMTEEMGTAAVSGAAPMIAFLAAAAVGVAAAGIALALGRRR